MKLLLAALTLSALVVLVPTGSAGNCAETPPSEGFAHPTKTGRYLYLLSPQGRFDATKIGEWAETNGVDGLQTERCFFVGQEWHRADKRADVLA
jgi:hypothetical protein